MPEREGVKPRNKTRDMTQGLNAPEEKSKVGKSTLADTDNLQVTPNASNLGNTLKKPDKKQ